MRHCAPAPTQPWVRLALAAALLFGASAASAHANGPIADRWAARGDRIDARLDARGERIDRRLDHRADVAASNGHRLRAERLDARGDRIENRLDHRGDRLERRADRIGQRLQGRRG